MWTRRILFSIVCISVLVTALVFLLTGQDTLKDCRYVGDLGNALSAYYYHVAERGPDRRLEWKWISQKDHDPLFPLLPRRRRMGIATDCALFPKHCLNMKLHWCNQYKSAWECIEGIWRCLQPHIRLDAQRFLNAVPLSVAPSHPIVIHYRLGDVVGNRGTYTVKRYEYYRRALQDVGRTGAGDTVVLVANVRYGVKNTEWPQRYYDDLAAYLRELGYVVKEQTCGTLLDDYCTFIRARLFITSGGSLGFFAGMSADPDQQVFVYPRDTDHPLSYEYRANMHALTGYEAQHRKVPNYFSTDAFRYLRGTKS